MGPLKQMMKIIYRVNNLATRVYQRQIEDISHNIRQKVMRAIGHIKHDVKFGKLKDLVDNGH